MPSLKDLFDLVREFGPMWGPPIIPVGIIFLIARHRYDYKAARGVALFRSRWILLTFLASLVVLPGYYFYRYRYWELPKAFKRGEIGILVGQVRGETNQAQQAAYAREILWLAQNMPELNGVVKVEMMERYLPIGPVKQLAKALQWGRWLRASFVLSPNAIEGWQEPYITVIDQPAFSAVEAPMGKFPTAQLANLDKLRLPSDVLLLARCTLALSFYKRSSFSHAASLLEQVLASQKLPKVAPARPDLDFLLGNSQLLQGENDKAIKAYRSALALRHNFAAAHSNLGVSLEAKGQHAAAIAEFREALQLKPDLAKAHSNLGLALDNKGQHDAAIAEYREALRLKPDLATAHNDLGAALYQEGRHAAAIAEYREALRLKPDLAEAHYNLGLVLNKLGRREDAASEFAKAHHLDPNLNPPH